MTIFVTGGAGFIGSNFILDWFQNSNESIVNIDCLTYAGNLQNLKSISNQPNYFFYKINLTNKKSIKDLFIKHKPRAIINFAAETHVDKSIINPEPFINTNILGTFNLINISNNFFSKLPSANRNKFRFLHISTDEVFGSLKKKDPPFNEDSKYKPNNPYSASKASSDHFVRSFVRTYGFPAIITNCSNNYGPFQFPEKFIPLTIYSLMINKSVPIYGDGKQIRDWLYVKDHCSALRIILQRGKIGEVYNIGAMEEKKNIDVVNIICNYLDKKYPKKNGSSYKSNIKFIEDRLGHDKRYAINSNKVKKNLGWAAKHSFSKGIKNTIDWYMSNPNWLKSVDNNLYKSWIKNRYK